MDDIALEKLRDIADIKEFIDYISPYYPGLNIINYTIEEIESALEIIYLKIIGKILQNSPPLMRRFLKEYILWYEIQNIKFIILGSITGMTKKEISIYVNYLAEEYLENSEFITDLLEITSLDEIQYFLKDTRYNEAVREGILYFNNNNEIFVLEAFLDQRYYKNLINIRKKYKHKKNEMISLFIDCITEIYNLNTIYRGIRNNIDRKLLAQFLVSQSLFFDEIKIQELLNQDNTDGYLALLKKYFSSIEGIKDLYLKMEIREEHLSWSLEALYNNYYFTKFKMKFEDIDSSTIFRIIEVILKKKKELKFDIVPNVVKLIHKKFENLK